MSTRYTEIVEKYKIVQQVIKELEEEYANKTKGDAYRKRKTQLLEKLEYFKQKALNLGTQGNICHVRGKRSRPSIRNPRILIQENFNIYFNNITEEEASALVKLHVKNVISYQIAFYKPGMLLTSS